ncbi:MULTISPECIES: hypothetical protein [unclassified Ruegeria]|uniref:hypothetical protein n=1 Tax=unclassified Ruegeria TaxID=2625375 RepID=UPI0014891380|nr:MULTISPECIES: hypothetical protein [unclassified Ruegeria]
MDHEFLRRANEVELRLKADGLLGTAAAIRQLVFSSWNTLASQTTQAKEDDKLLGQFTSTD